MKVENNDVDLVDFNGDGMLDVVAVSFLPYFEDFTAVAPDVPPETFAYLENQGGWTFAASTVASELWSRWARIAVGDLNGDGRPDIVLGDGTWGPFSQSREMAKSKEHGVTGGAQGVPALVLLLNEHQLREKFEINVGSSVLSRSLHSPVVDGCATVELPRCKR